LKSTTIQNWILWGVRSYKWILSTKIIDKWISLVGRTGGPGSANSNLCCLCLWALALGFSMLYLFHYKNIQITLSLSLFLCHSFPSLFERDFFPFPFITTFCTFFTPFSFSFGNFQTYYSFPFQVKFMELPPSILVIVLFPSKAKDLTNYQSMSRYILKISRECCLSWFLLISCDFP